MIHLAICDDEIEELNHVVALIEDYRVERNINLGYGVYQSPLDLIAAVESGILYDIIILDVVMPGENGIEAARELRQCGCDAKIIFLTSSDEFAVQSYAVGAYFYQLKPIWKENFYTLMEQVAGEINRSRSSSLIVKCKEGIARIPLEQLEYCEVIRKTIIYHMSSGKALESAGSMQSLSEALLKYSAFLQPHRSYMVNMDYIQNISYKIIELSCLAQIPIPRGKYAEIKERFLNYAFREVAAE